MRVRVPLTVGIAGARMAGGLSRLVGAGGGTTVPGKVLSSLDPEVLDRLAQSSVTRRLPVILFTLKQLTAEEQQRVHGRIASLAQKEAFNPKEFVGLVKEALQRTSGGRN